MEEEEDVELFNCITLFYVNFIYINVICNLLIIVHTNVIFCMFTSYVRNHQILQSVVVHPRAQTCHLCNTK